MPASTSLSGQPISEQAPLSWACWHVGPRGWVSCSLGSLESSKAHIWRGNVFSTRHSVDSLLRSCSQDVRAGAHPESAEAAQLEEVGRRAAPRPQQGVRGGELRVMHTSHKRKRACLPETPRLLPGWRRAGNWWKLGAKARVLLGSGDAFDEGRSQGVLAARDHDCAVYLPLQAPCPPARLPWRPPGRLILRVLGSLDRVNTPVSLFRLRQPTC